MLVFLDFEASSLGKRSYPIEVAWVFEDGRSESYLIHPALEWTDWDEQAEAIHHISRSDLLASGSPHDVIARRMLEELSGHDLLASAPSWDGKWMSVLLRAAGLPRHSLRLRASDDAHRESARKILAPVVPAEALDELIAEVLERSEVRAPHQQPAHRALADAEEERERWLAVQATARRLAAKAR
jgi:hypothetical protein